MQARSVGVDTREYAPCAPPRAIGSARRGEPHEERAAAGAVEVARDPVAALAAPVREALAADRLGERGGDTGRVHDAAPARWHDVGLGDSSGPEVDARYRPGPGSCRRGWASAPREARARGPAGSELKAGCKNRGADAGRRRLPEAEGEEVVR